MEARSREKYFARSRDAPAPALKGERRRLDIERASAAA
jgi:hypothetical protein